MHREYTPIYEHGNRNATVRKSREISLHSLKSREIRGPHPYFSVPPSTPRQKTTPKQICGIAQENLLNKGHENFWFTQIQDFPTQSRHSFDPRLRAQSWDR
jgi:hypothetical protein